jgi:hypothetical protein
MGQKVNPNIFRLGVNKKWKTEFFEKKSQELPIYTFKDLEIGSYIERFLETRNLFLHDYNVQYNDSSLNIYVSYFVTSSFIFNKKFEHQENILLTGKKENSKVIIRSNNNKNIKNLLVPSNATLKSFSNFSTNSSRKLKRYLKSNESLLIKNKKKLFQITSNVSNKSTFKDLNLNYSKLKRLNNLNSLHNENTSNKWLKGLSLFMKERYDISVTFRCVNKSFSLTAKQIQSLKEKFMLLQKFKNIQFFSESIDILFISVYHKHSSKLLAKLIASQLKKTKRHNFFLAFLKQALTLFVDSNFSKVEGVKIMVKGRLNGVPRARHKTITIGRVPVQTIMTDLDFCQTAFHNANGSYGVKVWIVERNSK